MYVYTRISGRRSAPPSILPDLRIDVQKKTTIWAQEAQGQTRLLRGPAQLRGRMAGAAPDCAEGLCAAAKQNGRIGPQNLVFGYM